MAFTVERLIASIKGNQMRCVAGFEGLSNPVTCFTIVDTPDIAQWVRSGAFVASIGYVTKENPRLKMTIVRDLAQKGCACLAVKVNQYYEEAREEFMEQGNRYGLPIVEVDYSLRFSDIASHIHQSLFRENMGMVEKGNLLYQQLIQSLLTDTGIQEVLYHISIALANPVLLLDKELQLIEYENIADDPIGLHRLLRLKRGDPALSTKDTRTVQKAYEENRFGFYNLTLPTPGKGIKLIFASVTLNDLLGGYLVVAETVTHMTDRHYQLLEHVKAALELYFIKNQYLPTEQLRVKNDFDSKVLLNDQVTKGQIQRYANLFGFDTKSRRICMDLAIRGFDTFPFEKRHSMLGMIRVSAARLASQMSLECFTTNFENHFPLFLFFPVSASRGEIRSKTQVFARAILKLAKEQEMDLTIGVSMCSDEISQIPASFRQALDMIALGEKIQPQETVHAYDDLQIYHMMDRTLSTEELRSFADLVWPLYMEDQENATNLVQTLDVFIHCKFNVTQAAAALFLHRNSLAYRINKIRDILGIDLNQQQDLFQIQMSICALKLYLSHQEE